MRAALMLFLALLLAPATAHGAHLVSPSAHVNLDTQKVATIAKDIGAESLALFNFQVLLTAAIPGDRLIIIDSLGGGQLAGLAMIATIEAERAAGVRVVCFVKKHAASMAFNILSHCDVRIAASKAVLCFHPLSFSFLNEKLNGRLKATTLRQLADELDREDAPFAARNRLLLNMDPATYAEWADLDHDWRAPDLISRGYLQGIGSLVK